MSYSKVIGEAIRQERKKQKLSMAELGSRMGISGSLVGRYERGEETRSWERLCVLLTL